MHAGLWQSGGVLSGVLLNEGSGKLCSIIKKFVFSNKVRPIIQPSKTNPCKKLFMFKIINKKLSVSLYLFICF